MRFFSCLPFMLLAISCSVLMNPAFDEMAEDAGQVLVEDVDLKIKEAREQRAKLKEVPDAPRSN